MRIFGFDIGWPKTKANDMSLVTGLPEGLAPVGPSMSSFLGWLQEPFSGAWQKNLSCMPREQMLAFSAVYACITIIANDIAKMRLMLVEQRDGVWQEVADRTSPYKKLLRKPNDYQIRLQFLISWVMSKLFWGNTYVLVVPDERQFPKQMHVLDPRSCMPVITPDGDVWYQLGRSDLAETLGGMVPAKYIIHDRMNTLWHPLVGISPIYACGFSATQGVRIQSNSATFFRNMSRPSGMLTAPGTIKKDTAERLKKEFESNYGGDRIGRLAILGDGLKYEAMTIPPEQAQLIEQLKWTVEDVARCFHVPLHKIQAQPNPTFNNVAAMNQDYYSQTLQVLVDAIEDLFDDKFDLDAKNMGVEFDVEQGLLRMDPLTRADVNGKEIQAGYLKPNEARRRCSLGPVPGGDTPYMQQQNFSLAELAKQKIQPPAPPPAPAPAPNEDGNDAEEGEEDEVEALASDDKAFREFLMPILKDCQHAKSYA